MKTTLTLFIICVFSHSSYAQSGTLDSSFGVDGKVLTNFNSGTEFFSAATQKDGKLISVGVGSTIIEGQVVQGFLVVRYLQNGMPDSSFGVDGKIVTRFGNGGGTAHDIVVQDDEMFIVAGDGDSTQQQIDNVLLARYKKDGALDSSFGINGLVVTDFGTNETIQAIALQRDNKIIVTGSSNRQDFFTARYKSNGSVDSTFGVNGKVITIMGLASANAVAIQDDGKIVEVGHAGGGENAVALRYLPNGMLDTSFANSGMIVSNFGYNSPAFNAVTIKPDGDILAAGQTNNANGNMLVISFTSSGVLNTTFGTGGKQIIEFDDPSKAVSINLSYNKVILSGNTFGTLNGAKNNFALCRLLENGSIDSAFGFNGKTITDFGKSYYEYAAKGLLAKETIMIVGNTGNYAPPSGMFLLIARYNNDESKKQIIIKKIKHYINTHNNAQANSSHILIYPNPASNILTVTGLSAHNNYQLKINNAKGDVVATASVSNNPSYELNVQNLTSGVYYLTVLSNQKTITVLKFIKE